MAWLPVRVTVFDTALVRRGALQTSLDIEGGSRSCEGELFNSNGHAIVAYSQFLVYTQLLSVIVHFICQLRLT